MPDQTPSMPPLPVHSLDYAALLAHSYAMEIEAGSIPPESRHEFLADHVFGFTTYDGAVSVELARRAVEVCQAINDATTFDYIADPDRYRWFLIMCNMPFFASRLSWGTSIRGAWWDHATTSLESCGLWSGSEQLMKLEFSRDDWMDFIRALISFGAQDDQASISTPSLAAKDSP